MDALYQLRHSPGFLGALLSTFRYFPLRYMDELFAAIGKHPRKVIIIAGSQVCLIMGGSSAHSKR